MEVTPMSKHNQLRATISSALNGTKKFKVDSPEHACARLQLHPCLTDAGAQPVQIRWCRASLEKIKA